MDFVIETDNLVKIYSEKKAVDNVSVRVKKGEIYGLIGKNGAGKTTLMKLILGLADANGGDIKLFGKSDLEKERMKIGSLIEEPGLYYNCSAYENLKRFSILYGSDLADINPLLEKVGLADVGKKKVKAFSMGMKQRLGIAVALLGSPEILILDEPINGLDPAGIKDVRDMIISLNQQGVTFMISSHLLDELSKIVTTYGIIANGKLIEEVSAKEVEARCLSYILIETDNDQKAFELLKQEFSEINFSFEDGKLKMNSAFDQKARINAFLVESGIAVNQIAKTENSIEDYFIERLGK